MMCQVEVIWDWQLKEIFCDASGHWLGGYAANGAHVPHLKQNDGSYDVRDACLSRKYIHTYIHIC
jgi:hypothetical protein